MFDADCLNRPMRTLEEAAAAIQPVPRTVTLHGVSVDLDRLERLVALANADLRTASISDQLNIAAALNTLRVIALANGKAP